MFLELSSINLDTLTDDFMLHEILLLLNLIGLLILYLILKFIETFWSFIIIILVLYLITKVMFYLESKGIEFV